MAFPLEDPLSFGINPTGEPPPPTAFVAQSPFLGEVATPDQAPPPAQPLFGMPTPIALPGPAVPEDVIPQPGEIEIEGEGVAPVAGVPTPTGELLEQPVPTAAALTSAGIEVDTKRLGELDIQRGRFDERADELAQQIEAEPDREKQAKLLARHQVVAGKSEELRAEQAGLRTGLSEQSAKLGAEAQLAAGEAQRAAARERAVQAGEIRDRFAVKEAERVEREQEATAQLDTDRQAYRALLKEGPTGVAGFGTTLTEIMAETLRAQMKGEPPNYGAINQRMAQRNQAAFQQRAKQALAQVELSGDRVSDEAHLQREIHAQEQAAKSASFEIIEQQLVDRLATLRDPLQRAQAAQAVEVVRVQRAQAEQAAQQARIDVEMKRRAASAKIALDEAKTQKELALTGKVAAEAAKAGRRGTGAARPRISVERQLRGLKPKEASAIKATGLRDSSGAFMGLAQGNPVLATDKTEGKRLNAKLAKATTINGLLNRLTSLRNEHGREVKATNSKAIQAAEGTLAELQFIVKGKGFAELGVLAGSDLDMVEKVTGGEPLSFYSNLTRWSEMRSRLEDQMNDDLVRNSNFGDLGQKFSMPETAEFVPRTREQAGKIYRHAYDPTSGTVVDTNERLAAFAETLSATEKQRKSKPEAWSQMNAEANSYIKSQGPKTLARMGKDWQQAVDAGDDARAEQIDDAMDDENRFIKEMMRVRTRLSKGVSEEETRKIEGAAVVKRITGKDI